MDITEKTKVPLFAVLIALPTLAAVVFWLAVISVRSSATTERVDRIVDKIHRMESDQDGLKKAFGADLQDMHDKISHIDQWVKDHEK